MIEVFASLSVFSPLTLSLSRGGEGTLSSDQEPGRSCTPSPLRRGGGVKGQSARGARLDNSKLIHR
jgi:hypothetical protein